MPIVGRLEEQAQLSRAMSSKKSEFIAVHGRRRVGKTFLIREFFSNQSVYFFQIVGMRQPGGSRQRHQYQEFHKELIRIFYQSFNLSPPGEPNSWYQAFEMLNSAITLAEKLDDSQRKIVLFFDELPWLATPKSGVLEAIDYFWNRYWVNCPRVILVVCGSASAWIIKNILNNRGGLHNRVTMRMPIRPLLLSEVNALLTTKGIMLNKDQVLQLYMVLGGIPYYLDLLRAGESAVQSIDRICFEKDGELRGEFSNLYRSLFSNAGAHIELIRLIASKAYGILRTDLAREAKLSAKGGTLSKRLGELEQSGFIRRIQLGHGQRGVRYQCVDAYTLFYLKWIEPTLNKNVSSGYWQSIFHTPNYYSWAGLSFEVLCYQHIDKIRRALSIPEGSLAYPWRARKGTGSAQIDLIFDRPDGVIHICEIKFTKDAFSIDKSYHESLKKKQEYYQAETGTKKQIFLSMVSAKGVKKNEYSGVVVTVAREDDLFA